MKIRCFFSVRVVVLNQNLALVVHVIDGLQCEVDLITFWDLHTE